MRSDFNTVPDLYLELDHSMTANGDVAANVVTFSHQRPMADVHVIPDDVAGLEDGMRTDHASCADDGPQISGVSATRRRADDDEVAQAGPLADERVGMKAMDGHSAVVSYSGISVM